ncbi:IS110 family transposase [Methylosinus sp. LW4]|uniref:IS110 family transposase n=1 Tax=Methylosinus sp. LW4 TaxID=136993 RepID=UPI00035FB653|nr:IS110 family transposase [Methylosinus sp. LW4]
MTDKCYIGVDVSKDWLDIARHDRADVERIENTTAAVSDFLARLGREPTLVVFESTGGYERPLRAGLLAAGVAFARAHPNEIAAFKARRGAKAKTDQIDARQLAAFGASELSARGLGPLVEGDGALREMTARRRQLVDLLQAERCRAAIAENDVVRQSLATLIAMLEKACDDIETEIDAHIAKSAELANVARLLRSLKGVGPVTVHTLLGELPELGRLTGKEISALVGLAPVTRQSGKRSFRATTGHGRPGVRRVLFNAARAAIRWNPVMKAFYERLVTQNQRPGKVALTAVMHKMLVVLNAIAKENKPWKHAPA